MRKFKIFTVIADIHIGKKHVSADTLKKSLKKYYIEPMKTMKYLDAIFVAGDILDTVLSMNTDYAEVFNWLASKLYGIAKTRKCPCIIIKGTRSHDNEQLNNIKHYQVNDDGVDFRIYENVDVIKLFDERFKVLLLPDVKVRHPEDIEKYYNTKYDLVIGHGTISTMQFFVQESENMPTKTYVYNVDKLMSICRGPIIFGHIHQHIRYKEKFFYVGSFDKLERGSDGQNGFLVCGISMDDSSNYKVEQFVNETASKYYNIELTKDIIRESSIDDLLYYLDLCISDAGDTDLISIKITRDDDNESMDKVLMIDARYRSDKRVSIKKKIKNKNKDDIEKDMSDKREKYSYIMDTDLNVSEIMYRYYEGGHKDKIDIESTVEVSVDVFKEMLGE